MEENIDKLVDISKLVKFFNLSIKGILHVGAHKCEENPIYLKHVSKDKIYWVEAIDNIVKENLIKNPELNIINECVSDKNGDSVEFKITNNTLSSSILELGEHKKMHPNVKVIKTITKKTKTLDTILEENQLENLFNLLVLDLQGAEMLALKGLKNNINDFNFIYTEVNEKEIYKNCILLKDLDYYLYNLGFERRYLTTLNNYGNALYIRK